MASEVATQSGPAIPGIVGEKIFKIGDVDITTTVLSTWIFMVVLFVVIGVFYLAIKTNKLPKIRTLGLDLVTRLNNFLTDSV